MKKEEWELKMEEEDKVNEDRFSSLYFEAMINLKWGSKTQDEKYGAIIWAYNTIEK